MPDEAAFSITKNFHTIRGNDIGEFAANVELVLGDGSFDTIRESYADAFGVTTAKQALATVTQAFPGATAVPAPVSSVGGFTPPPVPAVQAQPPANVAPSCQHGQRVYKESMARGELWKRYECAIPWSKDVQGRCKPQNI